MVDARRPGPRKKRKASGRANQPKKAAEPTMEPTKRNERLIDLRNAHDWSQEDLATLVEASKQTVWRWENDGSRPQKHHMDLLLRLFDVTSPEELGFTRTATRRRSQKSTHLVRGMSAQSAPGGRRHRGGPRITPSQMRPRLLTPPACPDLLLREQEVDDCKRWLLREGAPRVAMTGLPGVGKTALAARLACDPEIERRYPDGVVWVPLGPMPRVMSLLRKVASRLGVDAALAPALDNPVHVSKSISDLIGERRILIIIDDAWKLDTALLFVLGGPRSGCLVLTRIPALAFAFAQKRTYSLREFDTTHSIRLLKSLLPTPPHAEHLPESLLDDLARAAGGLPLALRLVSHHVSTEAGLTQWKRMREKLTTIATPERLLLLEERVPPREHPPSLPLGVPRSLRQSIGVSFHMLPDAAQRVLRMLTFFPEKPGSFSLAAARAVSGASNDVLDMLVHYGLVDTVDDGRYTIHQTIAAYLRHTAPDAQTTSPATALAVERAVDYYITQSHQWRQQGIPLSAEIDNALGALEYAAAWRHDALVVRGMVACAEPLVIHALYEAVDRLLPRAIEAARRQGDQRSLAHLLHWRGRADEVRGHPGARPRYREGLRAARLANDLPLTMRLLSRLIQCDLNEGRYRRAWRAAVLGITLALDESSTTDVVAFLMQMGDVAASEGYSVAEAQFYRAALPEARKARDREAICYLLVYLGAAMIRRGELAWAERCYMEGYKHACLLGQRSRLSAMLLGLGAVNALQGKRDEARANLQLCLKLARESKNLLRVGQATLNLGVLESACGNAYPADTYLKESLEIATRLNDHWHYTEVYLEMGNAALRAQQDRDAEGHFAEALARAEDGREWELAARAEYGRAQVRACRGDFSQARAMGQTCLAKMEAMQLGMATEVASWLDHLPPR